VADEQVNDEQEVIEQLQDHEVAQQIDERDHIIESLNDEPAEEYAKASINAMLGKSPKLIGKI